MVSAQKGVYGGGYVLSCNYWIEESRMYMLITKLELH